MSVPHFTCGCGWPSTPLFSIALHLPPSVQSIPRFSPLCQDVSSVSQHGVTASHKPAFPPPPLPPPVSRTSSPFTNLVTTVCGLLLPCIYLMQNQHVHFLTILAHRSNWHESRAHCSFPLRSQWQSTSAYRGDVPRRQDMLLFWRTDCRFSGTAFQLVWNPLASCWHSHTSKSSPCCVNSKYWHLNRFTWDPLKISHSSYGAHTAIIWGYYSGSFPISVVARSRKERYDTKHVPTWDRR